MFTATTRRLFTARRYLSNGPRGLKTTEEVAKQDEDFGPGFWSHKDVGVHLEKVHLPTKYVEKQLEKVSAEMTEIKEQMKEIDIDTIQDKVDNGNGLETEERIAKQRYDRLAKELQKLEEKEKTLLAKVPNAPMLTEDERMSGNQIERQKQNEEVKFENIADKWTEMIPTNNRIRDHHLLQPRGIREVPNYRITDDYLSEVAVRIRGFAELFENRAEVEEYLGQGCPPAELSRVRVGTKDSILVFRGGMGKGKTALSNYLCSLDDFRLSNKEFLYSVKNKTIEKVEVSGIQVRFLRITYNEGTAFSFGTQQNTEQQNPENLAATFGSHLLSFHGIDVPVPTLDNAIRLLRKKLELKERDVLVIIIDEIMLSSLRNDGIGGLVRELRNYQKGATALFFFTTLSDAAGRTITTASDRFPLLLDLPKLSYQHIMEILRIKNEKLLDKHGDEAWFKQMLLSTLYNPRQAIDGIGSLEPFATTPEATQIACALDTVIVNSNLSSKNEDMCEYIPMWFWDELDSAPPKTLTNLKEYGVLQPGPGKNVYFSPLLLRQWSQTKSDSARHLNDLYAADLALERTTETKFEKVMYSAQALYHTLALQLKKTAILWNNFFAGGNCSDTLLNLKIVPVQPLIEDFKKTKFASTQLQTSKEMRENALRKLNQGCIVLPGATNEPAIDYLYPLTLVDNSKCILAVQCKFAASPTKNYQELVASINKHAMTVHCIQEGLQVIPVIFSTSAANSMPDEPWLNKNSCVLFDEEGIFEFTRRFGILRLHVEKCSDEMKQRLTWAQNDETESQNDETESQNDETESQNDETESQNNETESQNNETES